MRRDSRKREQGSRLRLSCSIWIWVQRRHNFKLIQRKRAGTASRQILRWLDAGKLTYAFSPLTLITLSKPLLISLYRYEVFQSYFFSANTVNKPPKRVRFLIKCTR